ncbi:MAG: M48 family metallopeptidase, partial [Lachnospiraceae bacterium]|nr:M48 family metallopeptidase [Lachnospiraceae bacterium]
EAVKFSIEELEAIRKRAKQLIPDRAALYADRIGVTYRSITCRFQHSRWGSCSANGNLSLNCLLILAPAEVLDSVIVHELCHRKEMNHSPRFYAEVVRVFPEYRKWNKWLKEHGRTLLNRLP